MNTTHFLNIVASNVFGVATAPLPTNYYIGLSSTAPSVDGSNVTEPSAAGSGYARMLLDNLSEPNNGTITNSSAIAFPESKTNWGVMTHYVVFDSLTGGNLLFYESLAKSRTVESETTVLFKAGDLTLTVSSEVTK